MNDGFINEKNLIDYLHNKTFNEFNDNIKNFLFFLFGKNIDISARFIANKAGNQVKPDIYIEYCGVKKYISIKKGSGNSVHQETIDMFFPFFEQLLDSVQLSNIKRFHYGDDTIDDSGENRYSANQCKTRYREEIKELNVNINKWENLSVFLERFLFIGNVGDLLVDVVYYGTLENGLWASRDEIIDYVSKNYFATNAVHFGPLSYQVWGRNEKRTAKHPDRRYVMQVKWGSIVKDIIAIRKRNDDV